MSEDEEEISNSKEGETGKKVRFELTESSSSSSSDSDDKILNKVDADENDIMKLIRGDIQVWPKTVDNEDMLTAKHDSKDDEEKPQISSLSGFGSI